MHRFWIIFLVVTITSVSCSRSKPRSKAELAAERLCSTCHLAPKPNDLDRATWNLVLPDMIQRLPKNVMSSEDRAALRKYYIEKSPFKMPIDKERGRTPIDSNLFKIEIPKLHDHTQSTTFLKISEKEKRIFYGNAKTSNVYILENDGTRIDSFPVPGYPMDFKQYGKGYRFLTMGNFMPSDEAGSFYGYVSKEGGAKKTKVLISGLRRATDVQVADLNEDGNNDYIISNFGLNVGSLEWYEKVENTPVKHVLNSYAGNIRTVIDDYNDDGLLDIYALVAQGDERILRYENLGEGKFKEHQLLRLPPSYGSTYFNQVDIDMDGHKEILYVNGDNGDYTPLAKPYHGIHFYKERDNGKLEEILFLPMNGTFKAIADDFDNDGDLDIAAISYFPDYANHPEEGFVYFENLGGLEFERSTIIGGNLGRWISMDSGDIDGDGDQDIIIGSAIFLTDGVPVGLKNIWRSKSIPMLILKNQTL